MESIEVKFSFLRHFIFTSSISTLFCDGAVSLCTPKPKKVFVYSGDSSVFAVNCSVAKISTKPISEIRLMFLRPSEKMRYCIASAERKKDSERILKQKESALKKGRVKEIASNGKRRAEIGAE